MDRLNIKVNIEGIDLPLTVADTTEEKTFRDAATLIQRRLRTLRERYPNLPTDKYYYAMAMLNTAVDAVRAANSADTEPYRQAIQDLEHEIEEATSRK